MRGKQEATSPQGAALGASSTSQNVRFSAPLLPHHSPDPAILQVLRTTCVRHLFFKKDKEKERGQGVSSKQCSNAWISTGLPVDTISPQQEARAMCVRLPDTLTWTVGFVALILTSHPAVTLPGEGDALDSAAATGKLPRVAPQLCGTKGQEAIEGAAVAAETCNGQARHHPSPRARAKHQAACPQPASAGPVHVPRGGDKSCAHNTTGPQNTASPNTLIFMRHRQHTRPYFCSASGCAALQSRQKQEDTPPTS